jgi:hypothetical protein
MSTTTAGWCTFSRWIERQGELKEIEVSSRLGVAFAFALALAGPARAHDIDHSERSYGGPAQTWEDIERARQEIQRRIAIEYHPGDPAKSAAPVIKRRSVHRHPDPY